MIFRAELFRGENDIRWEEIPDIITKEQLFRLCRISKTTARRLLQDGIIPCEHSGKRTRSYKIRKADVQQYLYERPIPGEKTHNNLPPATMTAMQAYYTARLARQPDVLTVREISAFTGYSKTAINNWCAWGWLPHLNRGKANMVPKEFLVKFLCGGHFISIRRRTVQHLLLLKGMRGWEPGSC